jgi:hypothetical protein
MYDNMNYNTFILKVKIKYEDMKENSLGKVGNQHKYEGSSFNCSNENMNSLYVFLWIIINTIDKH